MQQGIIFSLAISTDAYLQYYRGVAKAVRVTAEDGRSLQFPAKALQPFVSANGIQGRFRLVFDEHHKFKKLEKISN